MNEIMYTEYDFVVSSTFAVSHICVLGRGELCPWAEVDIVSTVTSDGPRIRTSELWLAEFRELLRCFHRIEFVPVGNRKKFAALCHAVIDSGLFLRCLHAFCRELNQVCDLLALLDRRTTSASARSIVHRFCSSSCWLILFIWFTPL